MRLLVCGPRNLEASSLPSMCRALERVLGAHLPLSPGFVLGHGAARGADSMWEEALALTYERHPLLWLPVRRFPARWSTEGRAAGPLRNARMLEAMEPTYWLAAHWLEEPNTPGTLDMVSRLRAAGVPGEVGLVPVPATKEPDQPRKRG